MQTSKNPPDANKVTVTFRLTAPSPKELGSKLVQFTRANLIVVQEPQVPNPVINHASKLSETAHTGQEVLSLLNPLSHQNTQSLKLTPEDLKKMVVKFGAGWDKPQGVFGNYRGPILQMEAFPVPYPEWYQSVLQSIKPGDNLEFSVLVDKSMNLSLTISVNGAVVHATDAAAAAPTEDPPPTNAM